MQDAERSPIEPTPTQAPTPLAPTPEQEAILALVRNTGHNLIINSYAGTGKSSTLKLIDRISTGPILYLAFNRRVVTEAEEDREAAVEDPSVLAFSDTTKIKTFNGLGHGIWAETTGNKRLNVEKGKTRDLLRLEISHLRKNIQSDAWEEFWEIASAVGLAKSIGYIPDGKYPVAKRLATWADLERRLETKLSTLGEDLLDGVLTASIKAAYGGMIDYDDQIYMPALFGGTFPSFPLVLVDEAQDLNACNHQMLTKLRRSRLIAVGDPRQSIYAFRGAVTSGMTLLKEKFHMTEADLTVSFRCPEAIVNAVRWHVPQMKSIKPGGRASRLTHLNASSLPDNCAIICRNNAPLFKLAFQLLAIGRSVTVAGSEVGPKVIAIMRKLGDESLTREEVLSSINSWLQEKLAKQSSSAPDIADCMRVFARRGETLGQAIAYATDLFRQEGTIQLLTGHKAKGLEWDVVFHLDPWIIGEDEQELNLRYVITTRAKREFYEIDSRDVKFE